MQFIITDKVSFCTVSMTNDLGFADRRNFYEKWSRDGQRIAELLFAGNSLAKAQTYLRTVHPEATKVEQRSRVLQEWLATKQG